MLRTAFTTLLVVSYLARAYAQTWCGKNYMAGSPVIPPGGQFPISATSSSPLLAFRCAPAIKPYLPEDVPTLSSFIIDTPITKSEITGAAPISLPGHGSLGSVAVTVSVDGRSLATGVVPLNATKFELPFSLAGFSPRAEAYNVTCTAEYSSSSLSKPQQFSTGAALSLLPDPPAGRSVTKMDLRTGALLAKPATGNGGSYETVFPIGFYTNFAGYLDSNLTLLNVLKEQGFTVHPVPTFDNLTALDLILDRMQELGLYLMYDMRWTYMNDTAVTEEVNRIKNRPNLLLWYTGDEPDGTSDPLNATSHAYDLIYSLDGYHPVSLVLNCEDYFWTQYTSGSDIVMQDTYMISNNVTFSNQWETPCTLDYGCCGCDDCKGNFEDISTRMDDFAERLWDNGWDRTKAVWTVPQAFGNDTYWTRQPTGKEYIVQAVLGINHGGLGVVAWNDPTTPEIKASASALALALPTMQDFILSPSASFAHVSSGQVDVGVWTVGARSLVLATNLNYAEATLPLASVPGVEGKSVQQVFDSGASFAGGKFVFESTGTGGFIVS
ncbi:uncharacterized protein PHACADRAFT_126254 [Phanerochaete carnosa HHB-10118-sp]|uniref:Glycoside hydrolase family 2 protein n=1 Tax=Phanerochaete carnosa (strain HHB-10118-sp) TaxID=650164 RepID=K5WQ23_PHACS|nr:uncharacterized protein PHACADRAFT_126254 [Phanerochaete carnosa HHB-10118-sp]EKM52442.1 hypothetical protein PHACADRAFT_126254 [Phanerochaete carnosa HHB-10118-sp]